MKVIKYRVLYIIACSTYIIACCCTKIACSTALETIPWHPMESMPPWYFLILFGYLVGLTFSFTITFYGIRRLRDSAVTLLRTLTPFAFPPPGIVVGAVHGRRWGTQAGPPAARGAPGAARYCTTCSPPDGDAGMARGWLPRGPSKCELHHMNYSCY